MAFKYFAFVESCKDYVSFLVMRKSGPFDKQIYTKEDLDGDEELSLEFNDVYYALIQENDNKKSTETMFIGNNDMSDEPGNDKYTYTKKKLTMKVLQKYGIDKMDKMVLATAILRRHPVAMWLRPLLMKDV